MKIAGLRFLLRFLVIVVLISIFCAGPRVISVAEEYRDAYNSHSVEQVLALVADNAMIHMDGVLLQGKEKLRDIAQFDSVMNTRITYTDIKATGNTVTFTAKEQNDWLKLAGIPEYVYDPCSMTIGDSLITMIVFKATPQSVEDSENLFRKIADWASSAHGQTLAALARIEYNSQSAKNWLALLQQWKAETGGE